MFVKNKRIPAGNHTAGMKKAAGIAPAAQTVKKVRESLQNVRVSSRKLPPSEEAAPAGAFRSATAAKRRLLARR